MITHDIHGRRGLAGYCRGLKCLWHKSGGIAAIEFALVVPILLALVLGVSDLGMGFVRKMQVLQAAQSGAQYAIDHGFNSTAITNAVTGATNLSGIKASPAPSQSCGCPSGNSISTATCGAKCSNGLTASTYVTVNASYVYTMILPYPNLSNPTTFTAQAIVRTQ